MPLAIARVGDLVDERYELRREIARGGMGIVFEARHILSDRLVALKTLATRGYRGGYLEERLTREARALGRLRHPAIVELFDAGRCRKVGPYLAMEMLEGRSLDGLLAARKRLSLGQVRRLCEGIGRGLCHTHRRGVVHRDIKPGNIFVVRTLDGQEQIKLIDFGVARLHDDAAASMKLTQAGDVLGTIDYISPEQLMSIENADVSSDQYSFAVLLYECLTGKPPAVAARLSAPPPLQSNEGDDAIPGPLAQAIRRALEPMSVDRWPSMEDFLLAMGIEVQRGPSVEVHPLLELAADHTPHVPVRTKSSYGARRKHPRVPYVTPCTLAFSDGQLADGRSEEISIGGMLVLSASAPPPGKEDLSVRFALPSSGKLVERQAKVRWIKESRGRVAIGLQWTDEVIEMDRLVAEYLATLEIEKTADNFAS
jgi:serine/threonine protein kinase